MAAYLKDPAEVKDYGIDWSALLADTETITTSTWTVPTGITAPATPTTAPTATVATIWLSGGTAGTSYRITNHVLTSEGREFERSFTVTVEDM